MGRRVRKLRNRPGMTQQELADTQQSTSHHSVLRDFKQHAGGIQWLTRKGGRVVTLAADATTFR